MVAARSPFCSSRTVTVSLPGERQSGGSDSGSSRRTAGVSEPTGMFADVGVQVNMHTRGAVSEEYCNSCAVRALRRFG